ncbi:MAG: response regulator [Candidatus Sumerlaeia bacterium]|nr:response regulator [Candidatus Sumerlaeia bacterium]
MNHSYHPTAFWEMSSDWCFALNDQLEVLELNLSAKGGLAGYTTVHLQPNWSLVQIATQELLDFLSHLTRNPGDFSIRNASEIELEIGPNELVFSAQAQRFEQPDHSNFILLILRDCSEIHLREEHFSRYVRRTEARLKSTRQVFFSYHRGEKRFINFTAGISHYGSHSPESLESDPSLLWDYFEPRDRLQIQEYLGKSDSALLAPLIARIKSKSTTPRWVEFVITEEEANGKRLHGYFQDVTLLQNLAQKNNQLEALNQQLLENSPLLIGVLEQVGDDFRILAMNPPNSRHYGMPAKHLRGKMLRSVYPVPDVIDSVLPHYKSARETRQSTAFRLEAPTRFEEGYDVWVSHLYVNEAGNDVFVYQALSDSLSSKYLLNLGIGNQMLSSLLGLVPLILFSTNKDFEVKTAVGHGLDLLKITPAEIIGKDLEVLLESDFMVESPTSRADVLQSFRDAALGRHVSFDLGWRGRVLRCNLRPLHNEEAKIAGVLGITLDISDFFQRESSRQDLERRMQESQRLEKLGIMAGGIAHDYNNILTGITASLSLIQSTPLNEELREHLNRIQISTNQLVGLTNQMLSYSGRGKTSLKHADLNVLVREALTMLKGKLNDKVQIELNLSNMPLRVRVDETQINQILLNLITNASEAIESSDGHIRISTRKQYFTKEMILKGEYPPDALPGSYAKVIVEDNGKGMTEETRVRIFEPFFTTKFTGRGLGLSAVQGIVKGHKGLIRVESTLGVGTRFFVSIPISDETSTEISLKHLENVERTPIPSIPSEQTVLVIDDEEMILEVTSKVLQKLGYKCLLADGGFKALEKFERNRDAIRLVILDMTMPGMSGDAVLEQLREQGFQGPVIVMSGYSEAEVRTKLRRYQPVYFLAKPFRVEELRELLKTAELG